MGEQIVRVIREQESRGMLFQILETRYEFGTHYVLAINGMQGFHSTDLERVEKYMNSMIR